MSLDVIPKSPRSPLQSEPTGGGAGGQASSSSTAHLGSGFTSDTDLPVTSGQSLALSGSLLPI